MNLSGTSNVVRSPIQQKKTKKNKTTKRAVGVKVGSIDEGGIGQNLKKGVFIK